LSKVRTGTLKNSYGSATLPEIVWRALQITFSILPQNTETPQLWAELEAASGPEYPVEAVMKTWTEQKGFPVITVQSKQVIILFFSFALLLIFFNRSFTLFIILFIQFICPFANFFKIMFITNYQRVLNDLLRLFRRRVIWLLPRKPCPPPPLSASHLSFSVFLCFDVDLTDGRGEGRGGGRSQII
jgi:hypothetical protein